MLTGCIIFNPTEYEPVRPLTPPRILDEPGVTSPRLGNIVVLRSNDIRVSFTVPVEDAGTSDDLFWQVFLNLDRECVPSAGNDCRALRSGSADPNGNTRREVTFELPESSFRAGCNRVELWISSRFRDSGDRHTPLRAGDVDSATWWIFRSATQSDGGVVDPIETCAQRVTP
jgi:hypothetical protein